MYKVNTACSAGVRFYMTCHLLAVLANCFEGHFATAGKLSKGQLFRGEICVGGLFVSKGNLSWRTNALGAFLTGG